MNKPTIVCLCGSSRFREEYEAANRIETLAGRIVLSIGMFGHDEGLDMNGPVKAMLDQLHLRKIDLADEVLVINPIRRVCPGCKTVWPHGDIRIYKCSCGRDISDVRAEPYIGESTRNEIRYAAEQGKRIRYVEAIL